MKTKIVLLILLLVGVHSAKAQNEFDKWFENKSLRVDFILSGNNEHQAASLFQLREEPHWAGPVKNLIDEFGYGGYYINVYDKESGKLIYSRGFNTLFEEWRTTAQAKAETQGWTNSSVIPYPKQTVVIDLMERGKADMQFHSLLRFDVDPTSIFIDRGKLHDNTVTRIQYKGDPKEKVDLVFIGDGYSATEQEKFQEDARRFAEALFTFTPFDRHHNDFNVWAVNLVSEESGTDISGQGVYVNTALNSGFYTFDVDRYLTTPDMKSIRDAVWNVPTDAVFILVNSTKYGGGGMYNFYAIGTAHNEKTLQVFVHEFGHSFAGLADEYYSSEVAYDDDFYSLSNEPWEPNITTLVNFESKWKDMLPEGTPIPTPHTDAARDHIGVYEGGGYKAKGIYRPLDDCMMHRLAPFCPVCQRAIVRMINYYKDVNY